MFEKNSISGKHLSSHKTQVTMLISCKKGWLTSLKLAARTWITGVGSDEFPFGARRPGRCYVGFWECNCIRQLYRGSWYAMTKIMQKCHVRVLLNIFSPSKWTFCEKNPGESENLFECYMAVWDWSNEDVSKISPTGPPRRYPGCFTNSFWRKSFFGWLGGSLGAHLPRVCGQNHWMLTYIFPTSKRSTRGELYQRPVFPMFFFSILIQETPFFELQRGLHFGEPGIFWRHFFGVQKP